MTSLSAVQSAKIHRELKGFHEKCFDHAHRTMQQFAEQSIVIPTGPFAGKQWSADRQPWVKLWFDMIESRRFTRHAAVGPGQSGKSLNCFVIPACYHLFEIVENVGCGVPDMTMAYDKWEQDFKPVIMKSQYADQIPTTGAGSRGGEFESITFRNGATLKFLTAGGDDKNRAGATFRVLVLTEIDGYDEAGGSSRESDKISQMEGRLNSFETLNTVTYLECTASIETGRIWQEYSVKGSGGTIVLQCPHCLEWVTPEREHLLGWQDAENELDAREGGFFACPKCANGWTEEHRFNANHNPKLIHRGQTIDKDGTICGEIPRTLTGSFRWSAINNLFRPTADLAGKEYVGRQDVSEDNAAKNLDQFVYAKPAKASAVDNIQLDIKTLLERTHNYGRGIVPPGCTSIAMGLDLGGWLCHWTATAFGARARGYIIDYGRIHVSQGSIGLEAGLMEAMREFRELGGRGFMFPTGEPLIPDEYLIDSGWMTNLAYEFIMETGDPFRACKGLSVAGEVVSYTKPKSTGNLVVEIGDMWHLVELKDQGIDLLEIDANAAKTTLHARLGCDVNAPGAITMFELDRTDHEAAEERRQFVKHLTAEKGTQEFIKNRGTVTTWKKIRAANHHLDSTALTIIGGSINGVSIVEAMDEPAPAADDATGKQAAASTLSAMSAGKVAAKLIEVLESISKKKPNEKAAASGGSWARKKGVK